MNIFKALSFVMVILISSAVFANEPELILFNTPKIIVKTEKDENLQKFEINNDEIINLYSFKPVKKINKSIASR
jgi:hypothetical protein